MLQSRAISIVICMVAIILVVFIVRSSSPNVRIWITGRSSPVSLLVDSGCLVVYNTVQVELPEGYSAPASIGLARPSGWLMPGGSGFVSVAKAPDAQTVWGVILPLWMLVCVCAAIPVMHVACAARGACLRKRWRTTGRCSRCGYVLEGERVTCPECGERS